MSVLISYTPNRLREEATKFLVQRYNEGPRPGTDKDGYLPIELSRSDHTMDALRYSMMTRPVHKLKVEGDSWWRATVEAFWMAVRRVGSWLAETADRRLDQREFVDQVEEKW